MCRIINPRRACAARVIPYSGYFSRGNILVKVVILAISWKKFRRRAVCLLFGRAHAVFFVGKYFVVRLSTTKTTKILPPEKYPLYGRYRRGVVIDGNGFNYDSNFICQSS